ncbi:MAG: LPS assembly lipoprotein LptE [Methylophilaceae bacterium]
MKIALRLWFVLLMSASLIACGFHMRGAADVPFNSIYIQGSTIVISKALKKNLTLNSVKVLDSADSAELLLEIVGEESEKRILSLAGTGKVNEFELYYRVHYRTKLAAEALWSQVQTVEARRDYSYDDTQLLAKQGEEKRLNEDMQSSVVNSLVRRLSALKK